MHQPTAATAPAPDHAAIEKALAEGPTDGLPRTPFWEDQIRRGRTCVTLAEGRLRYLNVTSEMIRQSIGNGGQTPVMTVREVYDMYRPKTAREVEVMGPARVVFEPKNPLPCTGERGIAYIATEAAVRCYLDPGVGELPYEFDVFHKHAHSTLNHDDDRLDRDEN